MMPLADENKVLLRGETAWTSSAGRAWLGFGPYLLTLQVLVQGITCTPALQLGVKREGHYNANGSFWAPMNSVSQILYLIGCE